MTDVPPPPPAGAVSTLPPETDPWAPLPPRFERPKRVRPDFGRLPPLALGLVPVAAVMSDLALRTGVSSVASFLAVSTTAAVLWLAGIPRTRRAKLLLAAAVVFAAWLPLRASGWLVNLNGWTAAALLLAAALFADAPAPRVSARQGVQLISRLFASLSGWRLLSQSARPSNPRFGEVLVPIVRGLAFAFVPVVVLGSILASADVVFASTISPGLNSTAGIAHGTLIVLAALAVAGLVCVARTEPHDESTPSQPVGAVEGMVVLISIATLFGLFAIVQLIGALGGADRILTQEGLTQAEYSRSGFFQLLIAAGITLLLLTTLRAVTSYEGGPLAFAYRVGGATVSLLTGVIVAASILRLRLYTASFGLTTLRWYSTAFAWLLGLVFVMLAISHLTRSLRPWFGWATLVVTLSVLFAVNVLNPEARVAEYNLDRPTSVVPLDSQYLLRLSADAWPVLIDRREEVEDAHPPWALGFDFKCAVADREPGYGPFGFNAARGRLTCR